MHKEFIMFFLHSVIPLAFLLFFMLLSYLEVLRYRFFLKNEKRKADIVKELAYVSCQILDEEETLINYPNIAFYLSQVASTIQENGFDINRIRVIPLDEMPDYPSYGFVKEQFCDEIASLPDESSLLNLVFSCSELFGRIYKNKHPLSYAYVNFKKNQKLQILCFNIKFLGIMAKVLHKRIEERVREETEEKIEERNLDCNFVNSPDLA